MNLKKVTPLLIVLAFAISCSEEEGANEKVNFNWLKMEIDGLEWSPSMPKGDSCKTTLACFKGSFSGNDYERFFYDVKAFKDNQNYDDYRADNQFRLHIMDVTDAGKYYLTNSYKDYINYAFFIKQTAEGSKKYVSSVSSPFKVEIDGFIPTKYSYTGIKGRFSGVLFNEENSSDSIKITNGEFRFPIGNGFDVCAD